MRAIREASFGGSPAWSIVACAGCSVAYFAIGAALLRVFLDSARKSATLSLA
jgi:hypothetical protein